MTDFNPGGATSLDEAVKLRYEANADTNAFSDAEKAKLAGIAQGATANAPDAVLRDRGSHTGSQPIASVDGLQAALDARQPVGDYAPLAHAHGIAEIDGFVAAVDSRIEALGATGGISGPAAAAPGTVARFADTSGAVLADSAATVSEAGHLGLPAAPVPPLPPQGRLAVFGREVAGRMLPAFLGPSGIDSALQPLLARNKIGFWNPPGNTTAQPGGFGLAVPIAVGSAAGRPVATTNLFTRMKRMGWVSSSSPGSMMGMRFNVAQFTTGDGSGLGGFFLVIRFGFSAVTASMRAFVGMSASTLAPANVDPASLANCIGIGRRASDTNMHLFHGGTVPQPPVDLGDGFPADTVNSDMYELALFAPTRLGPCITRSRVWARRMPLPERFPGTVRSCRRRIPFSRP